MSDQSSNGELPFDPADFVIQPYRISLNDFEVTLPDGQVVMPHYGQSVWIEPWAATMDSTVDAYAMANLMSGELTVEEQNRGRDGLYDMLSAQVVAWDICDNRRTPYEQPASNPGVFGVLPVSLVWWIFAKVNGRGDPKKAGASVSNSPGTSSTPRARGRKTRTD